MPSITTWTRLEPQSRSDDVAGGVAARIHDPLWLLARQWQLASSRARTVGRRSWRGGAAEWRRCRAATSAPITPDTRVQAAAFDPRPCRWRRMVERQPLPPGESPPRPAPTACASPSRPASTSCGCWRLQPTSADYRDGVRHGLRRAGARRRRSAPALDPETLRVRRPRCRARPRRPPPARRVRRRAASRRSTPRCRSARPIVAEIAARLPGVDRRGATRSSASRRRRSDAWQPERHGVRILGRGPRLGDDAFGERTLSAAEYFDGRLDWHAFDLNGEVKLGTAADRAGRDRHAHRDPRTGHLPRDAGGAVLGVRGRADRRRSAAGRRDRPAAPAAGRVRERLRQRLVRHPDRPARRLARRDALARRHRHLRRAHAAAAARRPRAAGGAVEHVPALADRRPARRRAGGRSPTSSSCRRRWRRPLEGATLEEVLLLRDEMANLAWAIERRLESPLEAALERAGDEIDGAAPAATPADAAPLYRLASVIPPHWVPLLPMRVDAEGREVRLARAATLAPDGSRRLVRAEGRLLDRLAAPTAPLLIHEEEVPREGARVRRTYQSRALARRPPRASGPATARTSGAARDRAAWPSTRSSSSGAAPLTSCPASQLFLYSISIFE